MMKRISDWLRRVSNHWVTLSALVIFVLFIALVLPGQAAKADAIAGKTGTPDMSFYYSAGDLYHMAEVYGEQGRAAYVKARFTFDLVFPLVYTIFLTTSLSWVFIRTFKVDTRWQYANLVPVLGMLFDYLENLSASLVMLRYPARTIVIDTLAPVFTVIKWIFVNGSFVILFVGVAVGIWQWRKKRGSKVPGMDADQAALKLDEK